MQEGDHFGPPSISQNNICLQQIHRIGGDHQLLVGGNDDDFDLGVVGRDDGLLTTDVVLRLIELDAKELHVLTDFRAHADLVLTDTSRKDDHIKAAHSSCIGTDILLNTIEIHILSQLSTLITALGSVLQITHIRTSASQTGDTTLLIEQV